MSTRLNIFNGSSKLGTVIISDDSFTVSTDDPRFEELLNGFSAACFKDGIRTFIEPTNVQPNRISIVETLLHPGQPGFIPAFARRLRHLAPGARIEIIGDQTELDRLKNQIRHHLATFGTDQQLQPAVKKIIEVVDRLTLDQAREILTELAVPPENTEST